MTFSKCCFSQRSSLIAVTLFLRVPSGSLHKTSLVDLTIVRLERIKKIYTFSLYLYYMRVENLQLSRKREAANQIELIVGISILSIETPLASDISRSFRVIRCSSTFFLKMASLKCYSYYKSHPKYLEKRSPSTVLNCFS